MNVELLSSRANGASSSNANLSRDAIFAFFRLDAPYCQKSDADGETERATELRFVSSRTVDRNELYLQIESRENKNTINHRE